MGDPLVLKLFFGLFEAALGSYGMFLLVGALTVISEWKMIHCSAFKKIIYLFSFPLFMVTYVPISIYALFAKVEWKPIVHKPVAKNASVPVGDNVRGDV